MSNIIEPQILPSNQGSFVTKDSNGNIVETKPTSTWFSEFIKSNTGVVGGSDFAPKPQKPNQQQAQLEIAKQQAMMQSMMQEMTPYSGLTDKVFGKSQQGVGLDPQRLRVGTYMIIGAIVGRYVAKNMKKSTTLGMVVGGLAPLLAYQLSIEYDRKNMPKQEPKQKVAIEPTPMPNKPKPQEQEVKYEPKKDCPNGTKKVQTMCIKAPCPETEVCA